jgi:predicted nucleic acid-binding Zn ribbon protein
MGVDRFTIRFCSTECEGFMKSDKHTGIQMMMMMMMMMIIIIIIKY